MDEASIIALLIARARQLGIEPSTDGMVQQRMDEAARKAAVELRHSKTTEVNLPFLAATPDGPVHLLVRLPAPAEGGDRADATGPRLDPRVKLS